MNTLTTIIKKQEEQLKVHPAILFANSAITLQAIRSGTSGYKGENLIEWHNKSIKSLLQGMIEEIGADIKSDAKEWQGVNNERSRLRQILKEAMDNIK